MAVLAWALGGTRCGHPTHTTKSTYLFTQYFAPMQVSMEVEELPNCDTYLILVETRPTLVTAHRASKNDVKSFGARRLD